MIKYVVWDWNGTLLNDIDFCVATMNELLIERKLPELSVMKYGEIFQFPVINYYRELGFDFSKEPFESISNQFIGLYLKGISSCPLRENTKNIIQKIQKKGIVNIILTASKQSLIDDQISIYQLESEFESWHGIDNYHAAGKVDIGLKLIDSLQCSGEKILFIGDTLHDAEVADAMGVPCVLIPSGHQSISRLQESGKQVVESLEEIYNLIDKWNKLFSII